MTHDIKCWPRYYYKIETGQKTYELRKNDRDYQTGDLLLIQEFQPDTQQYTGRHHLQQVSHILHGPAFGLKKGYCIMSLRRVSDTI